MYSEGEHLGLTYLGSDCLDHVFSRTFDSYIRYSCITIYLPIVLYIFDTNAVAEVVNLAYRNYKNMLDRLNTSLP